MSQIVGNSVSFSTGSFTPYGLVLEGATAAIRGRQEIINFTQLQTLGATILPCLKSMVTDAITAQIIGVTNDYFKK